MESGSSQLDCEKVRERETGTENTFTLMQSMEFGRSTMRETIDGRGGKSQLRGGQSVAVDPGEGSLKPKSSDRKKRKKMKKSRLFDRTLFQNRSRMIVFSLFCGGRWKATI